MGAFSLRRRLLVDHRLGQEIDLPARGQQLRVHLIQGV
jgi:hypothetical protein